MSHGSRPAGRDQFKPLMRLVRILTVLSAGGWVNRDRLIAEVGYGAATLGDRRDELRRELRNLKDLGWCIESDGDGESARLRLADRDPRLATLLSDAEIEQLARAARAAGRDPGQLGLPDQGSKRSAPTLSVALRESAAVRLEGVLHALEHRCVLYARYGDRDRRLEVDTVRQTGTGRWLIVAREDGVQKQFRLDRFAGLRVGAPGTASQPQQDRTPTDPLQIVAGEPVTAVVSTTTTQEARVVRELGPPTQRVQAEGVVELTVPVVNRRLWRMRLYQLGTRATLLGPPELRHEVRTELRAFLEQR